MRLENKTVLKINFFNNLDKKVIQWKKDKKVIQWKN
jgi:hypothetical protein